MLVVVVSSIAAVVLLILGGTLLPISVSNVDRALTLVEETAVRSELTMNSTLTDVQSNVTNETTAVDTWIETDLNNTWTNLSASVTSSCGNPSCTAAPGGTGSSDTTTILNAISASATSDITALSTSETTLQTLIDGGTYCGNANLGTLSGTCNDNNPCTGDFLRADNTCEQRDYNSAKTCSDSCHVASPTTTHCHACQCVASDVRDCLGWCPDGGAFPNEGYYQDSPDCTAALSPYVALSASYVPYNLTVRHRYTCMLNSCRLFIIYDAATPGTTNPSTFGNVATAGVTCADFIDPALHACLDMHRVMIPVGISKDYEPLPPTPYDGTTNFYQYAACFYKFLCAPLNTTKSGWLDGHWSPLKKRALAGADGGDTPLLNNTTRAVTVKNMTIHLARVLRELGDDEVRRETAARLYEETLEDGVRELAAIVAV